MRLVACSSLTKCGAGLWVYPPCRQRLSGCLLFRARTVLESTEYASCSLGTLFYLMLKSNRLHGLFRALHVYLCLVR